MVFPGAGADMRILRHAAFGLAYRRRKDGVGFGSAAAKAISSCRRPGRCRPIRDLPILAHRLGRRTIACLRCAARRIDSATSVMVGQSLPAVGNTELPLMNRFLTP